MDSNMVARTQPDKPSDRARIIAVTGARGGVGATTVAVNLAWLLAHEQSRRVAIVDLDLGYGTVALSLDLEARPASRSARLPSWKRRWQTPNGLTGCFWTVRW